MDKIKHLENLVDGSKWWLHVEEGLGCPKPEEGDLPWAYGDTRITAMAVDPYTIYVYWEIPDEALALAKKALGKAAKDAQCCLRVYDTSFLDFDGANAHTYFDVRVERSHMSRFIHASPPGARFHVAFGLLSPEGYFAQAMQSNPVELPRNSVSSDETVRWMTIKQTFQPSRYASRHTETQGYGTLAAGKIEKYVLDQLATCDADSDDLGHSSSGSSIEAARKSSPVEPFSGKAQP